MSNPVGAILTALKTEVSTLLGASYKELKYVYNLEDNDKRAMQKAYGVGVRSGNTVSGVVKAATVDQVFFVTICDHINNRSNDESQRTVISNLYEQIDTLTKNIFQKKVNAPTVVLSVQDFALNEPEVIDKNSLAITVEYTIKYRSQTV